MCVGQKSYLRHRTCFEPRRGIGQESILVKIKIDYIGEGQSLSKSCIWYWSKFCIDMQIIYM